MDYFRGLNLRQISENTLAQLITRGITTSATFTGIFVLTYFQGFEFLGTISKIIAFITFFYLLTDLGLNAMFIKYYFPKTNQFIGNLIILRIGISTAVAIVSILLVAILPYNATLMTGYSYSEKIGISLFSLTLITHATTLSLNSLLQQNLKFKLSVLPSILSGFVLLTFIFLGAKIGNIYLVLAAYILSQLIYNTLLYKRLKEKYKIRIFISEFKEFSIFLLKTSAPLSIILFFNLILVKSDMLVLSLLRPNFDVGVYSFSYRIFDFLIIIPSFLASSMYPVLLQKEAMGKFMDAVKKYASLLIISSVVITLLTFTTSPLLKFLRGDFSLSVAPLQILSLSLPFFFLTSLMQWVLIIRKKMKALGIIYIFAALTSVFLNFLLIPHFNYFAAAAITVITEGLVFLLMIIYFTLQHTKIFQKAI